MKVYVVTVYRYGNKEGHSYVVGVYSEQWKALIAAQKEQDYRGGKYDYEVIQVEIDVDKQRKIIFPMKEY